MKSGSYRITPKMVEAARILAINPIQRGMTGLPVTIAEVAEHIGVHEATLRRWMEQIPQFTGENKNKNVVRRAITKAKQLQRDAENLEPEEGIEEPEGDYNSEEWLSSRSQKADQALLIACEKGNANALRTYYQLTKRLVEKQEITHKIDGSYIARANLTAERELREAGYGVAGQGMAEVQEEHPILRPDLRLSTGQGEDGNSKVPELAPPSEIDSPVSQ